MTNIDGSPFLVGPFGWYVEYVSSLAVDPTGQFAYATEFICPPSSQSNPACTGVIAVYAIDSGSGALTVSGVSLIAAENYPGAVAIDPSVKFAYVANGDLKSISAYAIDPRSGALTYIGGAPTASAPGVLAIDPLGRFLYVTGANTITAYAINPNGALKAVSSSPFPQFAQFILDPTGRFVYAATPESQGISGYMIDSVTGVLTPLSGSPFAAGPFQVAIGISTISN